MLRCIGNYAAIFNESMYARFVSWSLLMQVLKNAVLDVFNFQSWLLNDTELPVTLLYRKRLGFIRA